MKSDRIRFTSPWWKYVTLLTVVLVTAIMLLYLLHPAGDLRRNRYESFLITHYRTIAKYSAWNEDSMPEPDAPELAAYQDYLMTMDPATGEIPRDRLVPARKILMQKQQQKGVGELTWVNEPADIGGRTRSLMFDPSDTSHRKLWAAAVTGGLWVNNDITNPLSSWTPVNDFLENLSVSCLASDPQHPEILYAGTGEPQTAVTIYRESSGLGTGILKSVDGGVTWESLPSTASFRYITDIVTRIEQDTTVIYAGVISGVYKGLYHRSSPTDGVYRSKDGGATWNQVLPTLEGSKYVYAPADLELSASGRLFVGTMRNIDGLSGAQILYSDNGRDWELYDSMYKEIMVLPDTLVNIPGRVILAASPSEPSRIYAVVASGGRTEAGFIFYKAYAILRSDDGGATWQKTGMPDVNGTWANLAWHALSLAVDPEDPDVLYAGGLNQHKSSDGGETWHVISDWMGMYSGGGSAYIHADQHRLIFRNNDPDEIVVGTDGGIFYSSNGTEDYPDFNEKNNNYNTIQYYTCACSPQAGSSYYLAGTQDNGTLFFKGTVVSKSDMISGGDGAYCFFDTDQPDYLITSVYYNRYYVYQSLSPLNTSVKQTIGDYYSGIFINPADYDSRNNTLYANAVTFEGYYPDQLLRIDHMLTLPQGTYLPLNTGTQAYFSAVKVSPYSPVSQTTLFAGTQSGRLFRVEDANDIPEVTEIGSDAFPTANISCIALGNDQDHMLVTFSNYGVPSVWETTNGGATWTNVEGDLPDMPVRWGLYKPGNARAALLATETGIWMCDNLDASSKVWVPENEGLANVRTDMIRYRPSDGLLVAATHGRGLYTSQSLSTGTHNVWETDSYVRVFPNPAAGAVRISNLPPGTYSITLYEMGGQVIMKQEKTVAAGVQRLMLDIAGIADGTYILTCVNRSFHSENKLVIKH